jgi:hypothetical protein
MFGSIWKVLSIPIYFMNHCGDTAMHEIYGYRHEVLKKVPHKKSIYFQVGYGSEQFGLERLDLSSSTGLTAERLG